jgi:arsenate reductase
MKPSFAFLCVANSARSQMAEGLARTFFKDQADVYSAGSSPATQVNPLAVEALSEIGIDISGQKPKNLQEIDLSSCKVVITLCADEICPRVPSGVTHLHWPLDDPASFNTIEAFRVARDKIQSLLPKLNGEYSIIYQ